MIKKEGIICYDKTLNMLLDEICQSRIKIAVRPDAEDDNSLA